MGAVLAAAPARNTQFRVHATVPVDHQHDFAAFIVDIDDRPRGSAIARCASESRIGVGCSQSTRAARRARRTHRARRGRFRGPRGSGDACSISRTRASAWFQRRSSSSVTRRFSGSAASYWRCAREAAYRAASRSRSSAARTCLASAFFSMRHDRCLDSGRLHDAEHLGGNRRIDPLATEADAARLGPYRAIRDDRHSVATSRRCPV